MAHAPSAIVLTFNEVVTPVFARVLDRSGHAVSEPAAVSANDNEVTITLPRTLSQGAYLVTYRVISADAHPVSGSFPFAVGTTPEAWGAIAIPAQSDGFWSMVEIANRAIHLAGLLLASGGSLFLLLVTANDSAIRLQVRRRLSIAAAIGCVTAILAVGIQGVIVAETKQDGLLDPAIWHLGMNTTRGDGSAVAIAALILIISGLNIKARRWSTAFLSLGFLTALASFTVAGHAATAWPSWLAVTAWLVHTGMAAFWLGSFLPLLGIIGSEPAKTVGIIQNFSRLALGAVAALLSAGIVMAVIQVEHFAALTTSSYGTSLMIKMVLVAALLMLAAYNRFRLTPALARGDPPARTALSRTVRVELWLGFTILAVTAALAQQIPPRSMIGSAKHDKPSLVTVADSTGHTASIRIVPSTTGRYTLDVRLADVNGEPLKAVEVTAELSNPSAGVEPMAKTMTLTDPGRYRYTGADFVIPGLWDIRIKAVLTEFEQSTFSTKLTIP